jgi:hypothetical protein
LLVINVIFGRFLAEERSVPTKQVRIEVIDCRGVTLAVRFGPA